MSTNYEQSLKEAVRCVRSALRQELQVLKNTEPVISIKTFPVQTVMVSVNPKHAELLADHLFAYGYSGVIGLGLSKEGILAFNLYEPSKDTPAETVEAV